MVSIYRNPAYRTISWGILAVSYCLVQWGASRTITGNTIYSRHRQEDRKDITVLIEKLQLELGQRCATGEIQHVLFDDTDVFLPYIVPAAGSPLGRCELIRDTHVTPFSRPISGCETVRVQELTPLMRTNGSFFEWGPHYPGRWTEVSRWCHSRIPLALHSFAPLIAYKRPRSRTIWNQK
jgi:hypothetical protein